MVVLLHKPIVYNLNIFLCKCHDFVCSGSGEIKPETVAVAIFQISLAHPVHWVMNSETYRKIFQGISRNIDIVEEVLLYRRPHETLYERPK